MQISTFFEHGVWLATVTSKSQQKKNKKKNSTKMCSNKGEGAAIVLRPVAYSRSCFDFTVRTIPTRRFHLTYPYRFSTVKKIVELPEKKKILKTSKQYGRIIFCTNTVLLYVLSPKSLDPHLFVPRELGSVEAHRKKTKKKKQKKTKSEVSTNVLNYLITDHPSVKLSPPKKPVSCRQG